MTNQREIKFRAWDTLHKKMAEVESIRFDSSESGIEQVFVHYYNTPLNDDSWIPSNCLELMQFTGLKDKNGKEIYEGDILGKKNPDWLKGYSGKWEVKFGIECEDDNGNTAYGYRIPDKEFEVIGNIMENPELLK